MNKDNEIIIHNYNKIDFNNISFGKKKIKDNKQYIEIKYNHNDTKIPFYFKTSPLELLSTLKYNIIRKDYIETIIDKSDFYIFILKLEDYIKHLILQKSNKIYPNFDDMTGELIDEIFKTNIRLDRHFEKPIIKLNIINNILK